jgi:hypothetical protein
MSIYDDPKMQIPDDYSDDVKLENRGDRVQARVIRYEPLNTRYGTAAKYYLFDVERGIERTMITGPTGAKDLWRQLLKERPEPGDVIFIELLDIASGGFKSFDVRVLERGAGQPPPRAPQSAGRGPSPMANGPQAQPPYPPPQSPVAAPPQPAPASYPQAPPAPARAPQPAPVPAVPAYGEDEDDLFDR